MSLWKVIHGTSSPFILLMNRLTEGKQLSGITQTVKIRAALSSTFPLGPYSYLKEEKGFFFFPQTSERPS